MLLQLWLIIQKTLYGYYEDIMQNKIFVVKCLHFQPTVVKVQRKKSSVCAIELCFSKTIQHSVVTLSHLVTCSKNDQPYVLCVNNVNFA